MKKILVATDFSPCAGNAMEYAVELAKILKSEVCALHAISVSEGMDNNVYNAFFIEDYYDKKRQSLATWANSFITKYQYRDVQVSTYCDIGSLSNVTQKYIETNEVELLVMGTMGATGISGLFGSNAGMMVSKTKTPTLVIPLETKFSINPVITLATDFSTNLSPGDVIALNELILAFKSEKLTVLNILETTEQKKNEAGENKLKGLVKDTALEFKYIQEDNTKDGILNFIQANNTDILCVVKRHQNLVYRAFTRSTVNRVMSKPIKAILVLHE